MPSFWNRLFASVATKAYGDESSWDWTAPDNVEGVKFDPTTRLLVQYLDPDKPKYNLTNVPALIAHGLNKNPYVYRGLMLAAMAAAGIQLHVRRGPKGKDIPDHPLAKLLRTPNPLQGHGELIRDIFAWWLAAGDSYTWASRSSRSDQEGKPLELWVFRPDRMAIVPDAKRKVARYEYSITKNPKDTEKLAAEDVMHLKMFSGDDDWYGLSPLKVAARAIDQHNAATDANTSLLQNGMRPAGALIAKGILTPTDHENLKKEVREKYAGPRNTGKPLVLYGDLTYQQMGLSPIDMDWGGGKEQAALEILVALGIPPELCGVGAKTYANVSEARIGLMEETVLPLFDVLLDRVNIWLPPMYGPGGSDLEVYYDRNDIEVLQTDRQTKRQFALDAWTRGAFSLDQTLTWLGEEPVGGDLGKTRIAPSTMSTLDRVVNPPKSVVPVVAHPAVPGAQKPTNSAAPGVPKPAQAGPQTQVKPTGPADGRKDDMEYGPAIPGFVMEDEQRLPFSDETKAVASHVAAAAASAWWARETKYSPAQPRDPHGRWTAAAMGGGLVSDYTRQPLDAHAEGAITKNLARFGMTAERARANLDRVYGDAQKTGVADSDRDWYDTAHQEAMERGAKYGITDPRVVMGAVAATSPQLGWDDARHPGSRPNLELAERIFATYAHPRDITIDDDTVKAIRQHDIEHWEKMRQHQGSELLYALDLSNYQGRDARFAGRDLRGTHSTRDLPADVVARVLINHRDLLTMNPDGIAKGLDIARGADPDTVLGGPKVRSFYNNLLAPHTDTGSVTIDRHAIAMLADGLGLGKSQLSSMLQGGGGSKAGGYGGSYGWFGSQIAGYAREKGLLPQQMQAVTWVQWRIGRDTSAGQAAHAHEYQSPSIDVPGNE